MWRDGARLDNRYFEVYMQYAGFVPTNYNQTRNEEQPAFTNPWFFLSKTLQPGTHGDKPHPQEDKQHGNGQSRESNGAARGSRPGGGDVDADAESAAVGEPEGRAGADPSDRAEAAAAVSDGGSGSALPPTALSGEELLQSAPATPVILAQTLDDKVAEIIARYRLMDDRMAAVERQMMDLVRKLRAAPPGAVLAVPPLTAGAAPPPQAASEGPAAATTTAGPAEVSQAGLAPALGPQPQQPHPHGVAAAAAGGAGTGTATASKGQQAAADLLSGGGSSEEGKSRLFEINRIQSAITEVVNSGYLESVKGLRETLLVQEWGLQTKSWAQRRGVSAFEKWCAEHAVADVSYDTISVLYDDPDALHVLPTPRLRMMARAMIEQHTLQAYDEVFQRCTATAESMARVGLGDLLPHTAGVGQVLRGLLPGGLPFLSAGFWRRGLRQLWPFGRGGK
ncbi:hypothetical protein PLESTF_001616500 [Pleodorina starrii]|nr:hypothetical protein PLESTF_001616500 [Pleodorina starrii]